MSRTGPTTPPNASRGSGSTVNKSQNQTPEPGVAPPAIEGGVTGIDAAIARGYSEDAPKLHPDSQGTDGDCGCDVQHKNDYRQAQDTRPS